MSLFYDPHKKDTKPWVPIVFILVPIILIIIGYVIGLQVAKNKPSEAEKTVDAFKVVE